MTERLLAAKIILFGGFRRYIEPERQVGWLVSLIHSGYESQ